MFGSTCSAAVIVTKPLTWSYQGGLVVFSYVLKHNEEADGDKAIVLQRVSEFAISTTDQLL